MEEKKNSAGKASSVYRLVDSLDFGNSNFCDSGKGMSKIKEIQQIKLVGVWNFIGWMLAIVIVLQIMALGVLILLALIGGLAGLNAVG